MKIPEPPDHRETDTPEPDVRFPHIEVSLVGRDGNAYSILGRVRTALRRAKVPQGTIDEFTAEATSGDYNHLLATVMRWVSAC